MSETVASTLMQWRQIPLELNPCRKCGSPAVEHIRGEFHKDTRDDKPENHTGKGLVQMEPAIEDDYRIACSKVLEADFAPKSIGGWVAPVGCDNFLSWSAPTLKEVAKQRTLWNQLNPVEN